jgi:hypothetical protein
MSKFRLTLTALAVIAFTVLASSLANAQATRTWVSGVGDDVNPCSRTAPCKTYAGAISKTAVNGEISTLDPGGFGAVTITKSITIEGTQGQGYGSILHSGTTGVTVNFDSFSGEALTQRSVRLRNLNINGSGGSGGNAASGLRGIRITGGAAAINTEVFVEGCIIDGSFGNPGRGIEDVRSGGGLLSITDSTVRNMGGTGIAIATVSGAAALKVIVHRSQVYNCNVGIVGGTNSKMTVSESNVSKNTAAGLFLEDLDGAGVGTTEMSVDNCVVTHNATGFQASTGSTIIRVSNTTALNNTALFSVAGGGQVLSYNNNQAGGTAFGGPVGPS